MKNFLILLLIAVAAVSCSKKVIKAPVVTPAPQAIESTQPSDVTESIPEPAINPQPVNRTDSIVIYFAFDNDKINVIELKKLSGVSGSVEITGHTCPIGSDSYNDGLGLRRAQSVKQVLKSCTVTSLTSSGERQLVTTDPKKYSLNRRVVLTFIK
jgi:outer membrane protein OmpA-like peptidoglycan-associated protein